MDNSIESVIVTTPENPHAAEKNQNAAIVMLALSLLQDELKDGLYYGAVQSAVNNFNGVYGTGPSEFDTFMATAFPEIAEAGSIFDIDKESLIERVQELIDSLSYVTDIADVNTLSHNK